MPKFRLVTFNKYGNPRSRIIENKKSNYSPDLSQFGRGAFIEKYTPKPVEEIYKFKSSSSDYEYTTKKFKDKISCNCPGYWRSKDRECKHVKQIKNRL
tara:strand:- start:2434 stop:2727 length:294 start_codon:yes stop_codon:yes gene_type:complete